MTNFAFYGASNSKRQQQVSVLCDLEELFLTFVSVHLPRSTFTPKKCFFFPLFQSKKKKIRPIEMNKNNN